jgi:hypothetical protein
MVSTLDICLFPYDMVRSVAFVFLVKNWRKLVFSKFNTNILIWNHLFNHCTAEFISFSNNLISEFVIIRLVSSAYKTGLETSDITLGISLMYKVKSKGPSMDPWGTPTVTGSHLEQYLFESELTNTLCYLSWR